MYYYQHHIGDFIKDTANLSNEQMAVYLKMLWRYYADEKPFTDSAEDIAFAVRSDEKTVQLILRHFFVQQDDGWHQKRCDAEISAYRDKGEKRRNAANARWTNANALQVQSNSTKKDANQEPITKNQETEIDTPKVDSKVSPPDGVSLQVWADFLKHRRAAKAPVTDTAINGFRREAAKAGMSLEQALITSIENNWRGFKAEWIKNTQTSTLMKGVL